MENNLVAELEEVPCGIIPSRCYKLLLDEFKPFVNGLVYKKLNDQMLSPVEIRKLVRLLSDYRRLADCLDYLLFYSKV